MADKATTSDRETDEPIPTGKARLFDVRRVIGGLFAVYGLVLTVLGLFDGSAEVQKAAGVRINLWTGLAMLLLAAIFLVWQWLRPLQLSARSDDHRDTRRS